MKLLVMANSSYKIPYLFEIFFLYFVIFFTSCCLAKSTGRSTGRWTRKASVEAEAVAALFCSGHGKAFLDGLILQSGKPICECNACYSGPRCSKFLPDCVINVSK